VRAAELLAGKADADSLAAAGLLHGFRQRDQTLRLIAQAARAAPARRDIAWLHVRACETDASCDPAPLEIRLRELDEKNGVGWFGALARATKSGDEEGRNAALAAIGRAERVDFYWTTLIARLSPPVASTGTLSLYEAEIYIIGTLAAVAIPAFNGISQACRGERLARLDVLDTCRAIAKALLNGDTSIAEGSGVTLTKRVWPENSPAWVAADEARRAHDYRGQFGDEFHEWVKAHASEQLDLYARHRREQDAYAAAIVAMGKDPNPPPVR
jgi:hypothetical protein